MKINSERFGGKVTRESKRKKVKERSASSHSKIFWCRNSPHSVGMLNCVRENYHRVVQLTLFSTNSTNRRRSMIPCYMRFPPRDSAQDTGYTLCSML